MPQGNVSAVDLYLTQSGKQRIVRCRTGATHFAESRKTVLFDYRTSEEEVMIALKMLLGRIDLAGIALCSACRKRLCWPGSGVRLTMPK
jgi:hypothetical protein